MVKLTYLDTSAAAKLVLDEAESDALAAYTDQSDLILVASWLLFTEMLCAVTRRPEPIDEEIARQALDPVEFVDVTRNDLITASRLGPLRSNDAIHLTIALRMQADEIITYDRELTEAANRYGLKAVSPA